MSSYVQFQCVLIINFGVLFQTMTENKEELGAAFLQEMYEVNGNPDDVSEVKILVITL